MDILSNNYSKNHSCYVYIYILTFNLDYHYIDGKGPYLHYHVPPNMKAHHFIW